jgi:hypothetical protein
MVCVAKIIVKSDSGDQHLGDLSFAALPVVGDAICAEYSNNLNYLKVILVRHWPVPFPFVPDKGFPSTQRKEAFVEVVTEWIGSD